jgi:hypothetical protein
VISMFIGYSAFFLAAPFVCKYHNFALVNIVLYIVIVNLKFQYVFTNPG